MPRSYTHGRQSKVSETGVVYDYIAELYTYQQVAAFKKEMKRLNLRYRVVTKTNVYGEEYKVYAESAGADAASRIVSMITKLYGGES